MRRERAWAAAAGLVMTNLAGCGDRPNFGAPDPVERRGESILDLWQVSMMLGLAVAALVWGLIAFALIRFRRRSDDVPSQHPYNIPVELVYTVTPLLIVAGLFLVTVRTQEEVTDISRRPDMRIEVVGFQWGWQFRYDGFTVTGTDDAPPEMVLPVGRTVRLRLVSRDVDHSFWVPRFLSKRDLIPGIRNEMDVDVEETGRWVGRCAEYCGLDHYRMRFTVRAVEPGEFETWQAEQASRQAAAGEAP